MAANEAQMRMKKAFRFFLGLFPRKRRDLGRKPSTTVRGRVVDNRSAKLDESNQERIGSWGGGAGIMIHSIKIA